MQNISDAETYPDAVKTDFDGTEYGVYFLHMECSNDPLHVVAIHRDPACFALLCTRVVCISSRN